MTKLNCELVGEFAVHQSLVWSSNEGGGGRRYQKLGTVIGEGVISPQTSQLCKASEGK